MKIKLITRFSQVAALLVVLAVSAGNAFAIENQSRVVSPYWQSDSTSYSFIAVTHPSLSGMRSQIGVTINAIQKDQSAFGTATSFTVSAGSTQRVFIVRTNQSTINATSIPTAQFIVGSTAFQHGHVRVDPVATTPGFRTGENVGAGFRDVTMLSYWGAVVIETNTTGFAMEFIGDAHDSAATSGNTTGRGVSGVGAP
ncbi:MAG: hypothetical protein NPINA01_17590 [Nitrospinaceae bacterium]|nr:MAG: hypothetical protein NPINA01_17590 [Nitrospinaceae bacterium]